MWNELVSKILTGNVAGYTIIAILFILLLKYTLDDKKNLQKLYSQEKVHSEERSDKREEILMKQTDELRKVLTKQGTIIERQTQLIEKQSQTLDGLQKQQQELTTIVGVLKEDWRSFKEQFFGLYKKYAETDETEEGTK